MQNLDDNKRREFIANSSKLALASVAVGAGISPLLAKDSNKNSNKGAKMSSVKHISVSGAIGQMQKEWGYTAAVRVGNVIKISGQGGWDRDFNFPHKTLDDEVRQALDNVAFVLESAGSSWKRVYSVTSYFVDKLTEKNQQVLVKHFKNACENPPIWTNVQVAGLGDPRMRVEIVVEATID